ncbi:LLM class flavin-dependent oxidoreductase [Devosia rhodophyticola]|uniref:LLM class flavin-dependent oxidoreductase n=1 Tax=Devosia rhodophyticola TaxID=3026423 RepID=A0ABY7YT20_9HYPH|nr:LLM class flavin-dependent oxidoreductase [Devosia rhodophyticola]WDR04454.1 LLM class flavin-dependent oxidoreductase [Devosia rhodophyticola]
MTQLIPLSLQDLAPVSEGTSTESALQQTVALAQLADHLGYERVWYAEHHGMPSIASSSPEVLIASAAARTRAIHVGSGGVMLPNHVPLRVVETYRTLAGLYPNRIDLGIGRAGGSDGRTLQALRSYGGEHFSEQLGEMLAFDNDDFGPEHPFSRVQVTPSGVQLPPIWLLGSSGASASAAGSLGAGYAFAAHFSHAPAAPAFEAYRYAFRANALFPKPHAMLCVSVVCAPTDEEAQFLSGSQALNWALFHSGQIRRLVSPEAAAAHEYSQKERDIITQQSALWIIGSPETVREKIMAKVAETGADEVMITTTMHSYELRQRSYRLLADAFGLTSRVF